MTRFIHYLKKNKNMKNNKYLYGLLTFAAVSILATSSAYAYQGDSTKKGPNYSPDKEAAITTAINSNDYEAWRKLMPANSGVVQKVNKENFSKYTTMWKLEKSGNKVEASKIRKELGLGQKDGLVKIGSGKVAHKAIKKK